MTTTTEAERVALAQANTEALAERGRAIEQARASMPEPQEPSKREQVAYAKAVVDGVEAFIEQTRSGIGIGVTGDPLPRIITIEVFDAARKATEKARFPRTEATRRPLCT